MLFSRRSHVLSAKFNFIWHKRMQLVIIKSSPKEARKVCRWALLDIFNLFPNLVIRQLYAGSFEDYDQKDFDSLKELQIRATHYVKYYVAFCKDRLKFCLVEDCIQFNIPRNIPWNVKYTKWEYSGKNRNKK